MPQATENPTTSIFSNRPTPDLVDELGDVKARLAGLKDREDALKAELIARKVTEAEGALFRATVSEALRETLDSAKVKAEMPAAWWAAHCKIGVGTTVRVTARRGIQRKAA